MNQMGGGDDNTDGTVNPPEEYISVPSDHRGSGGNNSTWNQSGPNGGTGGPSGGVIPGVPSGGGIGGAGSEGGLFINLF
jgi:hypothetical protein